jgi:hypothetical protein
MTDKAEHGIPNAVPKEKYLAVIDGPCGATGAAAGNNRSLADLDATRRLMRKPLEKIMDDIRELFGRPPAKR